MRKVVPNGTVIKELRQELEKLSTQKEMANEIGVSVRTLRMIENENRPITVPTAERLAKALQVHRERIVSAASTPKALQDKVAADLTAEFLGEEDRLIPRYDHDLASATSDEGLLYREASRSHDIVCIIETALNEETGAYAQELFDVLSQLSYSKRNVLVDIPTETEIALRRRIRQLLVLLKGNDIWVYQTWVIRRLPERFSVAPEGEPCTHQTRFIVALGPPGEYGETTMRVPIDHGQPFILPGWKRLREARKSESEATPDDHVN